MESGKSTTGMSDVLAALGIDLETLEWQDLAICSGMDTNDFYENYESNERVAKMIDQACLSCPVMKQCLEAGTINGEHGVWGGIYLTAGKRDKNRNSHKTEAVWEAVRERIVE